MSGSGGPADRYRELVERGIREAGAKRAKLDLHQRVQEAGGDGFSPEPEPGDIRGDDAAEAEEMRKWDEENA